MKKFKEYTDAEAYAMEISAKQLKSIEIVKRMKGENFIVCDGGGNDRKCHDRYVMLITNYKSPFTVYSVSPKSGKHWDSFPTVERANLYYKDLIQLNYRTQIAKQY